MSLLARLRSEASFQAGCQSCDDGVELEGVAPPWLLFATNTRSDAKTLYDFFAASLRLSIGQLVDELALLLDEAVQEEQCGNDEAEASEVQEELAEQQRIRPRETVPKLCLYVGDYSLLFPLLLAFRGDHLVAPRIPKLGSLVTVELFRVSGDAAPVKSPRSTHSAPTEDPSSESRKDANMDASSSLPAAHGSSLTPKAVVRAPDPQRAEHGQNEAQHTSVATAFSPLAAFRECLGFPPPLTAQEPGAESLAPARCLDAPKGASDGDTRYYVRLSLNGTPVVLSGQSSELVPLGAFQELLRPTRLSVQDYEQEFLDTLGPPPEP